MRCLVTGADGFIGAHLCRALERQGHEVTGTALNRRGETPWVLGLTWPVEYGDVTDPAFVQRVVNSTEAEWVFHLAAVSIVRLAHWDPARALATNIGGTINVLEACAAGHVKSVVVASSDKAYGDHGRKAYTEDMPLLPTGPYEVSKACADHIARLYGREGRTPAMVLRACNVYGAGDLNWSRLIPNSCKRAVRGQSPILTAGASHALREWIDAESVAQAYIAVARRGTPGHAYNAGTGQLFPPSYVAGRIAQIAGAPEPIENGESVAYEIPEQWTDSEKLRALEWEPTPGGMEAHLPGIVDWYARYLVGAREYAVCAS